jgi:hypothetical protein
MEGKEENYNQRDKKERRLNSVYVIASWVVEFSLRDCVMGDHTHDENNFLFYIYIILLIDLIIG